MEYTIHEIDKIKLGDSLILDIDAKTGSFDNSYSDSIKRQTELLKAELKAFIYSKELKVRILFKDKNFKKIGIVVDNYKLDKFKSELAKKGFLMLDISPFKGNTTAITFDVPADQFNKKKSEIFAITNVVEAHFKRSN